jgi:hypothetical protein
MVGRNKKPIFFVTFGEIRQTAFGLVDCFDPILGLGEARSKGGFVWFKIWIELDHAYARCQYD